MSFWPIVTRLGEAQILLPAFAAVSTWLAMRGDAAATVARWLAIVAAAALITTVTKVAFLGFGIGIAALDFTGISGHAMFATALLPLMAHALCLGWSDRNRRTALALAYALAALIAASRVPVGAHSVSEVIAGFALGGLASWAASTYALPLRPLPVKTLVVGVLAWLAVSPAGAPPSQTHAWVIRLSLAASGRSEPYTRAMLHARPQALAPAHKTGSRL